MDIKKDAKFFIGKKVNQICFGLYQVQLHLDNQILIEVGAGIIYFGKKGNTQTWNYTDTKIFFTLNNLLGETVREAVVDNVDNLRLSFGNGESLEIRAAKDGNESYIIYYNNDFQIIY